MELKIRIKEVKEETRPITLEEKCMFLLSTDMHCSQKIRDEIEKRMDMLGLIRRVDSENILFRVETIRDATQEEVMAWHYMQMNKPARLQIFNGKEVILEVVNHGIEN